MRKSLWMKVMVGATATILPLVGTVAAFAYTTNTLGSADFEKQYEANAAQEQALWAQVSTDTTNGTVLGVESTVQNINNQISALYTSLTALDSGVSTIPQLANTSVLEHYKELQGQRQEIETANNKAWAVVQFDVTHHQTSALKQAYAEHNYWSNQLQDINKQISDYSDKYGLGLSQAPYMGARPELRQSILDLQKAAIAYIEDILQLQQNPSPTDNPTAPSNTADTQTTTSVAGSMDNSAQSSVGTTTASGN